MAERRRSDVRRLTHDVRWALENGLGPRDLVPMLERLDRSADPGSDAQMFARLHLAEVIVETAPFRAAVLCRSVLSRSESDKAWGVLGLAHTLLRNYRCAASAYLKALSLNARDPAYAHNLGHLYDVAFNRPDRGLPYLAQAEAVLPDDPEVVGSYAHALVRCGQRTKARQLLARVLGSALEADRLLERWADPKAGPAAEHALG